MDKQNFFSHTNKLAILGLVLDIPAFIIVSIGLLQVFLGIEGVGERLGLTARSLIIHPILVLGGMMVAICLNAIAVFRIRLEPQRGVLVTTITTEWKFANLAVLGLSLFLLCMILLYAFGENFQIVAR